MQQQRKRTDDDGRKRGEGREERRQKRGKRARRGNEARGEEGEGQDRKEARESGKGDSLNSTTLPLGGCSTSRPELEVSKVLHMGVWRGSGRRCGLWLSV